MNEEIKNSLQWEETIIKDQNFPLLIIDNWYSKNEKIAVWKELDYYFCNGSFYKRAENQKDIARNEKGEAKGKTNRLYLSNEIYQNKNYSIIMKMMYKQRSPQFRDILKKTFINYYAFIDTQKDSSLISYYEDNDFYASHVDYSMFTCLIWLHKDSKSFQGGDLIFEQLNKTVEFKDNRLLLFPSWYYHGVTPVSMDEDKKNKNLGRYTITHFYFQ